MSAEGPIARPCCNPANGRYPAQPRRPDASWRRSAFHLWTPPPRRFPPQAGDPSCEGNSLLSHRVLLAFVNCCAILVNGHECPVIQRDDETAFKKRLRAELLESSRTISIRSEEHTSELQSQ